MKTWVRSLASLSGLRTQHCYKLKCSWAAAIPIQLLAQELPSPATSICHGCGCKRKKKKKKSEVCKSLHVENEFKCFKQQTSQYRTSGDQVQPRLRLWFFVFCVFVFLLLRATPTAYGGSQARGRIGALVAGLHHSSWQHRILNPLSEARDQTHNLMVPSWIHFRCTKTGTPRLRLWLELPDFFFFFLGPHPQYTEVPRLGV